MILHGIFSNAIIYIKIKAYYNVWIFSVWKSIYSSVGTWNVRHVCLHFQWIYNPSAILVFIEHFVFESVNQINVINVFGSFEHVRFVSSIRPKIFSYFNVLKRYDSKEYYYVRTCFCKTKSTYLITYPVHYLLYINI